MKNDRACIFCQLNEGLLEKSTVFEDKDFSIIMDAYPLTSGHVLIIPKQHVIRLHELSPEHQKRLFELGTLVNKALRDTYGADIDCNILLNDGRKANQTVPHLHLHVIPRRKGDFLKSLPKLFLHITGLFGLQTSRKVLDEQARTIASKLNSQDN